MVNGQWSTVNGQWSMVNDQWSMVNDQRPTFSKCSAISHFRHTCPDSTRFLVNLHSRFRDISSRYLHEAQHSLTVMP